MGTVLDKYKHKRRGLRAQQEELASAAQLLAEVESNEAALQDHVAGLDADLDIIDRELAEQESKQERARRQASKVVITHRKDAGDSTTETAEERDFRIRHTRDFNKRIVEGLTGAVEKHPDLRPELSMLFDRENITMPSPSRVGSRTGSLASGSSRASSRIGGSSVASSRRSSVSRHITGGRTQPPTAAEA